MLKNNFDQKSDVALLSHKKRSKDKEMKRDSKIRVRCNPREINWKRLDNTSWVWRNKKKHKKVLQVKD